MTVMNVSGTKYFSRDLHDYGEIIEVKKVEMVVTAGPFVTNSDGYVYTVREFSIV